MSKTVDMRSTPSLQDLSLSAALSLSPSEPFSRSDIASKSQSAARRIDEGLMARLVDRGVLLLINGSSSAEKEAAVYRLPFRLPALPSSGETARIRALIDEVQGRLEAPPPSKSRRESNSKFKPPAILSTPSTPHSHCPSRKSLSASLLRRRPVGKLDSMKREDPELRDLELQMMVLMGDLERIEERKRKLMLCRKYLVEDEKQSLDDLIETWRSVCKRVLETLRDLVPAEMIVAQRQQKRMWGDGYAEETLGGKRRRVDNGNGHEGEWEGEGYVDRGGEEGEEKKDDNGEDEEEFGDGSGYGYTDKVTIKSLCRVLGVPLDLFSYDEENDCFQ